MLFFDLGNVLLFFDHRRACHNMCRVSGVAADRVWEVVFESGLEWRYERGEVTRREFYEFFCQATNCRPPLEELDQAASDIFSLNKQILPLLAEMQAGGRRLGILSNTNPSHWEFVRHRFAELLSYFELFALSYELRRMKPEPEIYAQAAKLAGVEPGELFFVDDRPENVEAARALGWDAHVYHAPEQLVRILGKRGELNR